MDQFGLTYDRLSEHRPDLIMMRMPTFGLSGPWRERTGYAQNMEQASGMAWVTGYPDGRAAPAERDVRPGRRDPRDVALLLRSSTVGAPGAGCR